MLKHMDRLRQQSKKLQIQATPGAEEEEAASKIVEKTEVVKGAAESSSLSSSDEKQSGNRNNFTINPEGYDPLMVEAFHFFGAQHNKEFEANSRT